MENGQNTLKPSEFFLRRRCETRPSNGFGTTTVWETKSASARVCQHTSFSTERCAAFWIAVKAQPLNHLRWFLRKNCCWAPFSHFSPSQLSKEQWHFWFHYINLSARAVCLLDLLI